jgi:hypothetical protein
MWYLFALPTYINMLLFGGFDTGLRLRSMNFHGQCN